MTTSPRRTPARLIPAGSGYSEIRSNEVRNTQSRIPCKQTKRAHGGVFRIGWTSPYVQIKKRATGRLKGSQGLHAANAQAEGEAEGPWKAR